MTTDLLFQIFQQHLTNPDCKIVSAKDFIQKVVRTYLIFLSGMGNIPQGQIEGIVEDLEAEVLEMFRKKTYGYYNLKEYRQSLKGFAKEESSDGALSENTTAKAAASSLAIHPAVSSPTPTPVDNEG